MRSLILSGSATGSMIVIGEGILNTAVLGEQWQRVNNSLSLTSPSDFVIGLALLKLFVLGYVLMWLYEVFSHKYGIGVKCAIYCGLSIALLIWGWALAGLLLAGYINVHIAVVTFFWGLIEIPLATLVGSYFYNKAQPSHLRSDSK